MSPIKSFPLNVLALCTGNSARSILCESLINHHGGKNWVAYSAGSHPRGAVHPMALQTLRSHHHDIAGLRSKSWNEFADANAPKLDIVITVCDNAAAEVCPVWHGAPLKIHWGIVDPAAASVNEQAAAFERTYVTLERRIKRMVELPIADLERELLQTELRRLSLVA
ncbi:MAG TPA: arsenate reductase ArsC [Steroidobacteraceae bacterium]|nr:arsenate reductase ArsC [Steroidobacteraceae bacterium]